MSVEYVGGVCRWSMSVEYVGRYVGPYSTDTRLTLHRHYQPHLGLRSADISVEYRPTLSADISADPRPTSRPILYRHLGRLSGKISTDSLSSVIVSVDTWPQVSVDSPPTLSADISADARWTSRPQWTGSIGSIGLLLGRDVGLYLGRYSTDIQLIVSVDTRYSILDTRYSTDTFGRHYRPTINRYLGRYSTDVLADIRARYRPTLGRTSVDMFFKLVHRQWPLHYDTTLRYNTWPTLDR